MRKIIWFNTHTRTADDRFVLGVRAPSISFIIWAMGLLLRAANACRASINSGSNVILV